MAQTSAAIIYNPNSGRPRSRDEALRQMTQLLGDRGVAAEARPTTGPNHASHLAEEAVRSGVDIVISYGGDGTLNEVIQGMIGSNTRLAIWPGGTANVAAHDLRLPTKIESLATIISNGKTSRIAVGVATDMNHNASAESNGRRRYFFMFAGVGLDASICRGVNPRLKRVSGQFAFWASGFKHLFSWKAEPFVVDVDGVKYEGAFALIGKGKSYGGGLPLTPHARLEDPWFEVLIVPPHQYNLRYFYDLLSCVYGNPVRAGMSLVKGRTIVATSSANPWVETDGELVGPLPMRFDVVPDALSVVVP
ncbi:MAG TPA: diacylglycerol kinase family protein [Blastocatellia bacterium]|nr:diacylglycerol kinase family protein [Blastocatellia bacterium]